MRITRPNERSAGFTIVELAIVITMIMILCAIAVPGYRFAVLHAKEQTLREDLRTLRKAIDQYASDKQQAPQALEDLVSAKYISSVPVDPMTGSADTWQLTLEDDPLSLKGSRGIVDVKSGSDETDATGNERYSDW
jgi:general secretion pathway protein G